MEINAIPRRLAFTAGGQQLINWGISFYMPGTFAGAIAAGIDEYFRQAEI